jgi:hypothetical protein
MCVISYNPPSMHASRVKWGVGTEGRDGASIRAKWNEGGDLVSTSNAYSHPLASIKYSFGPVPAFDPVQITHAHTQDWKGIE